MAQNFYSTLAKRAFWKTGVESVSHLAPDQIFEKRWSIEENFKIGAAGSCFAQHISRHLRTNGYKLMDVEGAPMRLPRNQEAEFGYSLYSGRYGNIYTNRQLLQLVQEVFSESWPEPVVWEKDGRYYDAIRPNIEPGGFASVAELSESRSYHLGQLEILFKELDVFIFTMGLTEAWENKETGRVVPVAPGVIAGEGEIDGYRFSNFGFEDVVEDFQKVMEILQANRSKPTKYILTVSPVPLTATASGNHVLCATTYSKSVLRAAAGHLFDRHENIDYFPSYEIITNPSAKGAFFAANLRSVLPEGVEVVMNEFFRNHPPINKSGSNSREQAVRKKRANEVQCEEAMLEAFGQ